MPLTDTVIRAAKPSEKQQKLFDGSGLYLLLFPNGSKIWRFKYHFQGQEKPISLGAYPAVGLKDARENPDVIELQLAYVPNNQVRAAYNRAEYLPERRKMMDEWAGYLDALRGNIL